MEKIPKLANNFPNFLEAETVLLFLEDHATLPYSESDASFSHRNILFV
jgi:hypothetical protein